MSPSLNQEFLQPANFIPICYRPSASLLFPFFLPSSKFTTLFSLCLMSLFKSSFLQKYTLGVLGTCSRREFYNFLGRDLGILQLKNRIKQCDMVKLLIIKLQIYCFIVIFYLITNKIIN